MRKLLAAALLLIPMPAAAQTGFEVGALLPDLELPTIDGESTLRLSELRGQRLLLVQFASW